MGATAAAGLVGPDVRVTRDHGKLLASDLAPLVIATIHPSAVLCSTEREGRELAMRGFVEDLRQVAARLG